MKPEQLEPRRLLASMEVDLTFGEGGIAGFNETPVIANFYVVRQLPDGRIIGAGFQGSGPTVARFNANGSLDTTFGDGDGQIETSRNSGNTSVFGVDGAAGADGKIVLLHKRVGAVEEAHVGRFNAGDRSTRRSAPATWPLSPRPTRGRSPCRPSDLLDGGAAGFADDGQHCGSQVTR